MPPRAAGTHHWEQKPTCGVDRVKRRTSGDHGEGFAGVDGLALLHQQPLDRA
jgi:hypothetical protein